MTVISLEPEENFSRAELVVADVDARLVTDGAAADLQKEGLVQIVFGNREKGRGNRLNNRCHLPHTRFLDLYYGPVVELARILSVDMNFGWQVNYIQRPPLAVPWRSTATPDKKRGAAHVSEFIVGVSKAKPTVFAC